MRVVVTADFHGHLPPDGAIDPCEILILAGDVLPHQANGLDWFAEWLERQPAEVIVGIAGNHDFVAEDYPDEVRSLPWMYLQDEAATVELASGEQVKVWGSPRSAPFNDSLVTGGGGEDALEKVWASIPDDTEFLVVHGPAHGLLDLTKTRKSVGSWSLRRRLEQLRELRLFAFGHIHESYGMTAFPKFDSDGKINWVAAVNGAYVDERFAPSNDPIVITFDKNVVAAAT